MKRILYSTLVTIFSLCLFTTGSLADTFSAQAIAGANTFATTIDSGNYQAAFMSSSNLLRLANDKQEWIDKIERSRKLLGKVLHRELRALRSISAYPGLPDGDYLLIHYKVQTKRKAKASEIILLEKQNNSWAVCSYSIR